MGSDLFLLRVIDRQKEIDSNKNVQMRPIFLQGIAHYGFHLQRSSNNKPCHLDASLSLCIHRVDLFKGFHLFLGNNQPKKVYPEVFKLGIGHEWDNRMMEVLGQWANSLVKEV